MGEIARTARLIGLHHFEETCAQIELPAAAAGPAKFATYLGQMLAAQGEQVTLEADGLELRQHGWRLMRGVYFPHPPARDAALAAWSELWRGALAAYDRRLALSLDTIGERVIWKVS
ncbi:MAG: hypothetical protein ACREVG_13985 [Burkholderiales bacterium]